LLNDAEMDVRLSAAQALVSLGEPLDPAWVEPVIKSKHHVFQNAIWLVRRHAGKEAVPALIRCLDANNPEVNNYYNYTLVWQIHASGGPDLKYHHDFDNKGTPEQVAENRKVLSELIGLLRVPANDGSAANSGKIGAREASAPSDRPFAANGPATLTTAISPDGRVVAVGHAQGKISIYDVETGRLQASWNGHSKNVTSLSFDPTGASLVSGGSDKAMRVWDPTTGKERLSYMYDQRVTAVEFSPDGKSVFAGTGYRGGIVYKVDLEQKTSTEVFNERNSVHAGNDSPEVRNLAISRDGQTLAVAVFRGIVLIDLKTLTELRMLPEDESVAIRHCCFSPDSGDVASASKIVTRWNAESGEIRQRLNRAGTRGSVTAIQFSPDGEYLIAGIDGGEAFSSEVAVWKTGDKEPTAILNTGTPSLKDTKLTPDGKHLLTCHASGLKFWDFKSVLATPGGND
jgi:WD40 repeat protein